jgi:glucokinase
MILAGDIGGTHTRIALFDEQATPQLRLVLDQTYPSREHHGLEEILSLFLSNQQVKLTAACFGVAGPVFKGQVTASNLAWVLDTLSLAKVLNLESVWLINDLAAHAFGIEHLAPHDLVSLNAAPAAAGNRALIAAGTGLGEAGVFWDGMQHTPFASEGGHADFAPRNEIEIELHRYLLAKFGRVSCERILSGRGLKNIYDFLRDSGTEEEPASFKQQMAQAPDPAALIAQHGLLHNASICSRALEIFASVYGAETGNVALRFLATGGVYLSGGIAPRIRPKLQEPGFMQAFQDKGRMTSLMQSIPVHIVINDRVGLLGAAHYAWKNHNRRASTEAVSA